MAYTIPTHQLAKYKTFLSEAKKHAGHMSVEFQRRRAAFQFARARESSTGAIDMRKLAFYKTRDDIFRSSTQLANAQSHGMFMLIDHSISMCNVRESVVDRVIELCEFCRLSSIPFVVYGFTTGYTHNEVRSNVTNSISMTGVMMLELVNSRMSQSEYAEAILDYWYSSRSGEYCSATEDHLGSTPLQEALILSHTLAKDFKRTSGIQKLNMVVISDGDGNALSRVTDENGVATSTYNRKLEMELNGERVTVMSNKYTESYTALVKNLRKTLDAKLICFFLFGGNRPPDKMAEAGMSFDKSDIGVVYDKLYGYDAFFGMKTASFNNDDIDDADDILERKLQTRQRQNKDTAVKVSDIRAAFVKSAVNHAERNQFAQKFVQMIA